MNKVVEKRITKEFAGKVEKEILKSEKIVISSHISPDDDSISSILSMYYYITKFLDISPKKVRMINAGKRSDRWDVFKNYTKIEFVGDLEDYLDNKTLLILLDGSDWNRFSHDEKIKDFGGKVICIDHHPNPEDIHDLHLIIDDGTVSSCSEIIYRLFLRDKKIDKNMAKAVLLGILGDSGNFAFINPKNSEGLVIAKEIIDKGDISLNSFIASYESVSFEVFKAISLFMNNSKIVKVGNWPDFILSFITEEQIKDMGFNNLDIGSAKEIFANDFLRMVRDITWGVVIKPVDNYFSFSLRSLPESVNCRIIMEKTGWGGGHDHAAGGDIKAKTIDEAIKKFTDWLEKNKPVYEK